MALDGIPAQSGNAREDWIFKAVCDGRAEFEFADVTSSYNGRTAVFRVFADALKIDGVRVNVSAETEQRIADVLGCSLMTPKIADLRWRQRAVHLLPHPRLISSSTDAMKDHSAKIDADLASKGYSGGIVSTVGKHWVIDNDLLTHKGMAENYGWHFVGNIGINGEATASRDDAGKFGYVIQGRGWRHDMKHCDYSQICVLVSKTCLLDGAKADLHAVLSDPATAALGSHQGTLRVFRQPGVPEVVGISILPTVTVSADDGSV